MCGNCGAFLTLCSQYNTNSVLACGPCLQGSDAANLLSLHVNTLISQMASLVFKKILQCCDKLHSLHDQRFWIMDIGTSFQSPFKTLQCQGLNIPFEALSSLLTAPCVKHLFSLSLNVLLVNIDVRPRAITIIALTLKKDLRLYLVVNQYVLIFTAANYCALFFRK